MAAVRNCGRRKLERTSHWGKQTPGGLFCSLTIPAGIPLPRLINFLRAWLRAVEAFERHPIDAYYALDYRDRDGAF
jgi:hypothetical protein